MQGLSKGTSPFLGQKEDPLKLIMMQILLKWWGSTSGKGQIFFRAVFTQHWQRVNSLKRQVVPSVAGWETITWPWRSQPINPVTHWPELLANYFSATLLIFYNLDTILQYIQNPLEQGQFISLMVVICWLGIDKEHFFTNIFSGYWRGTLPPAKRQSET